MKTWMTSFAALSLGAVVALSGCNGSDNKEGSAAAVDHAETAGTNKAPDSEQKHSKTGEGQHGPNDSNGSSHSHGATAQGHHASSGQQLINQPFSLSQVDGVVASTSLTAVIAQAAGAKKVTYIAPIELRHPPEYDYRPSDVAKVKNSYIVYLGYEPFMSKLMEASREAQDRAATIEIDNTPEGYKAATRKLAEIWGTQAEQTQWQAEFDKIVEEVEQSAKQLQVSKKKVISQVYMTPFVKWLGYEVIGEFGPDELTPTQLAKLAALKPDLIVDNLHMPQGQGFLEMSKDIKRVELRSYPDSSLKTIQAILTYNASQLGITSK
ncbi:hypothetical protein [Paenibacillus sp. y28]|uniref:hypothetical protein n=1 Tax=Paenibacillus sp. y28 TaxID=3129110 RepID=UPI00301661CF